MSLANKRFCSPNRSVRTHLAMSSDEETTMDSESLSDVTNTDGETYHDHSQQQETNEISTIADELVLPDTLCPLQQNIDVDVRIPHFNSLEIDSMTENEIENLSFPLANDNGDSTRNLINCQRTNLTDLSNDLLLEIFDYLPLGEIYRGFYHLNQYFKQLIDRSFTHLNLTSMFYNQFMFYLDSILFNNDSHYQHIVSLTLSNRKPMNQIDLLFPYLDSYRNLKRLCLHSPTDIQLELLALYAVSLSELNVIRGDYISSNNSQDNNNGNIKWLSNLGQLEKCSIDCEVGGAEIDESMRSLSCQLSSLSITLSSTHDFYALLDRLPIKTLRHLHVRLLDSVFYYFKDHHYSLSSSTVLTELSFDMFSVPLADVASLYNIIRFVSNTCRYVKILSIRCRFDDGLVVDESRLRNSLSFLYSMKTFHFYLEMNDLLGIKQKEFIPFNEIDFKYSFWTEKQVHVNVYRTADKTQIERVKIYTLPLSSRMVNFIDDKTNMYKSSQSALANIHQYVSDSTQSSARHIFDDVTLIPGRIRTTLNTMLLPYLSRVSSLQITDEELANLSTILRQIRSSEKTFPTIRHLHINRLDWNVMPRIPILSVIFPRLQSVSIGHLTDIMMLQGVFQNFLPFLSSKQSIVHLSVSVLDSYPFFWRHADQQQLITDLEAVAPDLQRRKNAYKPWYDPRKRQFDIWL